MQGDWIVDAMVKLRNEGINYCDATHEAEKEWREKVTELSDETLFPQTKSWFVHHLSNLHVTHILTSHTPLGTWATTYQAKYASS